MRKVAIALFACSYVGCGSPQSAITLETQRKVPPAAVKCDLGKPTATALETTVDHVLEEPDRFQGTLVRLKGRGFFGPESRIITGGGKALWLQASSREEKWSWYPCNEHEVTVEGFFDYMVKGPMNQYGGGIVNVSYLHAGRWTPLR